MIDNKFCDFLENPIEIGQTVIVPLKNCLHIGFVKKIHKKMVTISIFDEHEKLYYPNDLLVVDHPSITTKLLKFNSN